MNAFLRGMCAGAIAGAAVGLMIPARRQHAMKTALGRSIQNLGCAVDTAADHVAATARHMW